MAFLRKTITRIIGFGGLAILSALAQADTPAAKPASQQESVRQWHPDAGIKTGMEAIRQQILGVRAEIAESRLDAEGYRRLAASLEQIANALPKEQSAADKTRKVFHTVVMVDLRWGIEMMKTSPKADVQRLGALSVLQALRNYGQFFIHPGWEPVP